jgi:uncharacterized protein (DUF1778 family)
VTKKSDRGDGRTKRGGSDTARQLGQVGIVVHVSPEERRRLGTAAGAAGLSVKEFCRRAALEVAEREIRKIPQERA